jgi:hypothetical protein
MGYSGYMREQTEEQLSKPKSSNEILAMMKQHPNFKQLEPIEGETPITFALRCAAYLISPPQQEEESYDLECVDIAGAIIELDAELTKVWLNRYNGSHTHPTPLQKMNNKPLK